MTKIDIFSGFLGAGKTTLIKKLIAEAYTGEKIVLIENEFGEIAIDGGFLQGLRRADQRDELRLHLLQPRGRLRRRAAEGARPSFTPTASSSSPRASAS